jgi:low affinity Fe/Cu permease
MDRFFTLVASRTAFAAGQPAAFIVAVSVIAGWGLTGPLFGWSDTWQLVVNTGTTIATFLMVFLIQNSQNRDAAAMQAKLDELIRAVHNARNEFVWNTRLARMRANIGGRPPSPTCSNGVRARGTPGGLPSPAPSWRHLGDLG